MRTEVKQEWMDGLSPDGEHSDVSSKSVSLFICVCHYHWDLFFFVLWTVAGLLAVAMLLSLCL